ncbi:MAG: NAD(P)H-dependent oxidoreductase [Bacteroidota bacterium]
MKKRILAFGASNSKRSINRQLANYAAYQIPGSEVTLIDLNDFEMPIYSIDREQESGIPEEAYRFKRLIEEADGIIISFAEHNGSYTVAFKNIYDWISRIDRNIWLHKPMFALATSPGPGGGKSVLATAMKGFSFTNNNTVASFSLPSFRKHFNVEEGILQPDLSLSFNQQLEIFTQAL